MAPLVILTWWWGTKYPVEYVGRLARGLDRHLKQPYRLICVHGKDNHLPRWIEGTRIPDPGLCLMPGCFARLRTFCPEFHEALDIAPGSRIVWLDLDLVITGPLDPLFDRDEDLVVLQGANASNPCPYNGSVLMLRAGAHAEVWDSFSIEAAQQAPYHEFPDDQGWIWHKCPEAAGWPVGLPSGIYAFQKPGWPANHGSRLPAEARIVCFPGSRDPKHYDHLDWVRHHWIGHA